MSGRVLLLASLLVGCAPAPPPAQEPPPPAPPSSSRLAELTAAFDDQACPPDTLETLRALRAEHGPGPLRAPLIAAYTACDDPAALADVLEATLSRPPGDEELVTLAAARLRAEQWPEAVEVLLPVSEQQTADSLAAWLLAFARTRLGPPGPQLEALQTARQHATGSDGHLLVALAALDRDDAALAIRELEAGLDVDGAQPLSLLPVLAQAYEAAGRPEDARRAADQAAALHAAVGQRELKRNQLGLRLEQLELAWREGRAADVLELVERVWPDAPLQLRPTLLEYRVVANQRLGREDDAEAAREALLQARTAQR